MIAELAILGIFTGIISGFFGVGGGTFLIPSLLLISFNMKEAIAISIMQMVFSSIYGSILNFKNSMMNLKYGFIIGIGGFLGGLQSSIVIKNFSNQTLQYIFILVILFAIYKVAFTKVNEHPTLDKKHNIFILFFLGFIVGLIAISIGVGGSIMLTPILVGFLYYNIKEATSLALFFIIFSSLAGFISLSFNDQMLYYEGFIVGTGSLFGVFIGVKLKALVKAKSYKNYILILYFIILAFMLYKTFNL